MKYHYQMTIRLEASAMPKKLRMWLEKSLPEEFRVMHGHSHGKRVIVVMISGSSAEDVTCKGESFMAMVRASGFEGEPVEDEQPRKRVQLRKR